jgi:hypothetical protein
MSAQVTQGPQSYSVGSSTGQFATAGQSGSASSSSSASSTVTSGQRMTPTSAPAGPAYVVSTGGTNGSYYGSHDSITMTTTVPSRTQYSAPYSPFDPTHTDFISENTHLFTTGNTAAQNYGATAYNLYNAYQNNTLQQLQAEASQGGPTQFNQVNSEVLHYTAQVVDMLTLNPPVMPQTNIVQNTFGNSRYSNQLNDSSFNYADARAYPTSYNDSPMAELERQHMFQGQVNNFNIAQAFAGGAMIQKGASAVNTFWESTMAVEEATTLGEGLVAGASSAVEGSAVLGGLGLGEGIAAGAELLGGAAVVGGAAAAGAVLAGVAVVGLGLYEGYRALGGTAELPSEFQTVGSVIGQGLDAIGSFFP